MSGNPNGSACDPKTVIHNHPDRHELLTDPHAYYDERRRKVVYLHGDEFHENCDNGHTHRSRICLTHEFTKVAQKGEDCSKRDDCHVHVRDDGVAEVHHPPTPGAKVKTCTTVAVLKPLT